MQARSNAHRSGPRAAAQPRSRFAASSVYASTIRPDAGDPPSTFDYAALKAAFGGVYIANEGFSRDDAEATIEAGEADAVAFGKLFIANPDLPRRFVEDAPLNNWDAATFYTGGARGYIDYPALGQE